MTTIEFNEQKMEQYYTDLDVIELKYGYLLQSFPEAYSQFYKYENCHQFAELTKISYWDLQSDLDITYKNEELTDKYIWLYDVFLNKIVYQYLNIDGIEHMFSEKYANFEWEMHLGIDYKKHELEYYRDHFVHQLKDAYMMAGLLSEGGFEDKISQVLKEESNGKISRFVCKHIEMQLQDHIPKVFYELKIVKKEKLFKHYMHNIICMSAYMAGLFHDIGYPLQTSLQEYRRMVNYMPESYHFYIAAYDFNQISILLQNSLLFRVVSAEKIRSRIEGDKMDHGVLSALLFLLHFYENGAIYRLEPYKLCAVELAAVAIYNHTNKYACQGAKEWHYERCLFASNPISFLLRICDDLQEWGRIYFEVQDKSNLIFCESCKRLIKRRKRDGSEEVSYYCACKKDEPLFSPVFSYHNFPSRRLYNITVCTGLRIKTDESRNDFTFSMDYDLGRLLQIAYLNIQYAKHISAELNKVKALFQRQYLLGQVFLDYFVSNNVVLIKAKLLYKYLNEKKDSVFSEIDLKVKEIMSCKVWGRDELINLFFDKNAKFTFHDKVSEVFSKNVDKRLYYDFCLYLYLCCMMHFAYEANTEKVGSEKAADILDRMKEILFDKFPPGFFSEAAKEVVDECVAEMKGFYNSLEKYTYYPERYLENKYEREGEYYFALEEFLDIGNYDPSKLAIEFNAYDDLYYFNKLIEML